MALSTIGVGSTANDGTGDPLRTAFQTVNTAITAVNNAVVVGTGTTTFKDDSGTYGVAVASNGDVTFTNGGTNVGMTWDASANSDAGGLGIGTTSPNSNLEVVGTLGSALIGGHTLYLNRASANYINASDANGVLILGAGGLSSAGRSILLDKNGDVTLFGSDRATAGFVWDTSANSNAGGLGIGTATPTEQLDLSGDAIRIRTAQTPASAAATGNAGTICWDASYVYVCTATNTWKRAAIATW